MTYKITYTTSDGSSCVPFPDAVDALEAAKAAFAAGGDEVWIADGQGRLCSIEEMEQFLRGPN